MQAQPTLPCKFVSHWRLSLMHSNQNISFHFYWDAKPTLVPCRVSFLLFASLFWGLYHHYFLQCKHPRKYKNVKKQLIPSSTCNEFLGRQLLQKFLKNDDDIDVLSCHHESQPRVVFNQFSRPMKWNLDFENTSDLSLELRL